MKWSTSRLSKSSQSPLVSAHVLLMFPIELLYEVVNQSVVKIFASQMSIACCGLDLEDSFVNA